MQVQAFDIQTCKTCKTLLNLQDRKDRMTNYIIYKSSNVYEADT